MRTALQWIPASWPGRLTIMPRPRGGDWLEDEVQSWRAAGVDVAVSLLSREEINDLDLANEAELCQRSGIEMLSFPIVDRSVPVSRAEFSNLVTQLAGLLSAGKNIAIHCRQGIGRAGLVAAAVMIMLGIPLEEALQQLSELRGCSVPETPEQKQWLVDLTRTLMLTEPGDYAQQLSAYEDRLARGEIKRS